MNYRKYYCEYHRVEIPIDYDIHHIDYNHKNNDINNLVALPKELHKKLHDTLYEYQVIKLHSNITLDDIGLHSGKECNRTKFIQALQKYVNVIEECVPYMNKVELSIMQKER